MPELRGLVLITGCSGWIGKKVIKQFENHYRIIGFDRMAPTQKFENFEYISVDITSKDILQRGLNYVRERYGPRINSVIHLASRPEEAILSDNQKLIDSIIVKGTENLLHGLKHFKIEQFILLSTMYVYAPCGVGQIIDEESPLDPHWGFPKAALEAEKKLNELSIANSSVILQIARCYDDEGHGRLLSRQIETIANRSFFSHFYPGDVKHGVPYLHVNDLSEAIWQAVVRHMALPEEVTLLIGEDRTMSYDLMQKTISQIIHGTSIKTYSIPKWLAKCVVWFNQHLPFNKNGLIKPWMIDLANDNYTLNVSKAIEVLGWQPKHFIGSSLPKIIKHKFRR